MEYDELIKTAEALGMTIKDVQNMQANRRAMEKVMLEDKVTNGDKTPLVNFEPNKQLKNHNKDNNLILTIQDSEFYYEDGETEFYKLNPYATKTSHATYDLFVQYCVFSDSYALTEAEIKNYDTLMMGIKRLWRKRQMEILGDGKFDMLYSFVSSKLTHTNRQNIFVWFEVNNRNSFAFAEKSCHAGIPRNLLSSDNAQELNNYLMKNVKGYSDIMNYKPNA